MKKQSTPPWYTKRNYLHFDLPISSKKAEKIVSNEGNVASHAFFPFISYTFDLTKLDRDIKTGKLYQKPKDREVAYSSHIDSHIYAYYSEMLSAKYEEKLVQKGLEDSILAFRKINGKSNIHFANDAFNYIRQKGECSAVALDFSKFFDTLDHQMLKSEWSNLLGLAQLPKDHYNVFKSLTKFSKVDRRNLFDTFEISQYTPKANGRKQVCTVEDFRLKVRKSGLIKSNLAGMGIPQGSPISALLSNVYMLSFDEKMKLHADSVDGKYYRYCDDMLFIVPSECRDDIEKLAIEEISKLKVSINHKKTELRDFNIHSEKLSSFDEHGKQKPLQYLGFLFDGHSIFLRSTALARYSEKMRGGVKLAKDTMNKKNRIRCSKGEKEQTELYKRKLHRLYSYRGKRNFLSYGYRAAIIMNSSSIKKQLKPLWNRLQGEINN